MQELNTNAVKIHHNRLNHFLVNKNSTGLSQKQIAVFADKLSKHPEFSSKYAEGNESYEQLAARIAVKLADPAQQQKWMPYLIQVGFQQGKGAAA